MKLFKFYYLIIILLCAAISSYSQVNYEPVTNSVYNYLNRMSNKGLISTNEEILPFSRLYIAGKLNELRDNIQVSHLEKTELDFYLKEFYSEMLKQLPDTSQIKHNNLAFGFNNNGRFRLFNYESPGFNLSVDPVINYSISYSDGKNSTLRSNGLKLFGNINNNFGFDIVFYDNRAGGDYYDASRIFTDETGYGFKKRNSDGSLDFDYVRANLTYSWDWGNITIGKDFNYYGTGESGNIIMSSKAPSFPYLKLEFNPVEWFRFSYIHGFLDSQILDSSTIRINPGRNHFSNVEKYFVTHMFSFTPLKNLNFSLGESVIYSDKLEPIYFIPIIPFRLADHYLTAPDERAGNAQIFGSLWYKNYSIRTKFYGSVFIDELTISNPDNPSAIAYNIGFHAIDPLIPESELIVEYTKIQPFVYSHIDPAQTYNNFGYQIGHWIGDNSDQIYLKFRKRIIRGLNFELYYSYIRKGELAVPGGERYKPNQNFLWGLKKYYSLYGFQLSYEFIHSLYLKINYNINKTEEEIINGNYINTNFNEFSFLISYGL